ncbi:MAG: hypothetical protein IJI60_04420 [Bacilli bacterium]|nr:hypothetical protein [Bacilli bacterium]
MIDTVTDGPGIIQGFLRALSIFDRVAFGILEVAYRLFFLVTSSVDDLIKGTTVADFFGRIQLILGVFMMFQLAITILKGIMDPNSFTNEKTGAGNIIMRIMTSLLILTLIVPISISNPGNDYEKEISANGILFGTLYSLQHRILENNTLAKLIIGEDDVGAFSASSANGQSAADSEEMKKSARIITSTLVKVFYRINLKEGATDDQNQSNYMCNESYADYKKVDVEPQKIIGMVDDTCMVGLDKRYKLTYVPIIPALLGGLFAALFLSFIIDIVIRSAKLTFLRLLAPIPVISYMDPNGSKDSSFNSWVKLLTSTYLDLFTRLLVLYFSIFMIQEIFAKGSVAFVKNGGFMGALVNIIIAIGLLVFAKDAPKFLKQMLGIKDDGGRGFFQGVGEIAAGAAIGMGAISGYVANARSAQMSQKANHRSGTSVRDRLEQFGSGLFGAASGVGTGVSAAYQAKSNPSKAAYDAMAKRRAEAIAMGAAGSTLGGRIMSGLYQFGRGNTHSADLKREVEELEAQQKAVEAEQKFAESKVGKYGWNSGTFHKSIGQARDSSGNLVSLDGVRFNWKAAEASWQTAKSTHQSVVKLKSMDGTEYTITMDQANAQMGSLKKSNWENMVDEWSKANGADAKIKHGSIEYDIAGDDTALEFLALHRDTVEKTGGREYKEYVDASGKTVTVHEQIDRRANDAKQTLPDMKRKLATVEANDRFSANKKS